MFRKAGRISLFGVWLASFALLLQTVLPLINRPASAEDAALPFASDLVLCTAHGLAKVSAADLDNQANPGDSAGKTLKCPLCQVWHSLGSALPASAVSVLGPAYEVASSEAAPARPALSRVQLDPLQPRAPPHTA